MPDFKPDGRPDVCKELANLRFEMRNKTLPKLPRNVKVQRRPLNHAPVASPHAGKHIQKVVYVSRRTPLMSAVKRVKKLLSHVEKRAMQGVEIGRHNSLKDIAEANEKLNRDGEKVFVKASGRAMEQALRVAEWFKNQEAGIRCSVEVTTGSVQAIDDLIEDNEGRDELSIPPVATDDPQDVTETTFASSDFPKGASGVAGSGHEQIADKLMAMDTESSEHQSRRGKRIRKRKRLEYTRDEVPEARIRWIKTIEVAISLKA